MFGTARRVRRAVFLFGRREDGIGLDGRLTRVRAECVAVVDAARGGVDVRMGAARAS
jgi:hypothetical protein